MKEHEIFKYGDDHFCCLKILSEGQYACLHGGDVILLNEKNLELKYKPVLGFKYIDMSSVRGCSVFKNGTYSREHTVELFGQDSHSDINLLIQSYGKVTSSLFFPSAFRVMHNKKERFCPVSGDYIPAHFPKVKLPHYEVSLGFFYAHLRTLTDDFRDDNPIILEMLNNGITENTLNDLNHTSSYYQWHFRKNNT